MRRVPVIAVVACTLALSACGSSGSKASSSPTISAHQTPTTVSVASVRGQFEAYYSALVKVQNPVLQKLSGLPGDATGPQVQAILNPLIAAARTYQTQLTDINWPSDMVNDAHALITQIGSVIGVLESVSGQNAFSINTWVSQLESTDQAEKSAANILRHDLGLPPSS